MNDAAHRGSAADGALKIREFITNAAGDGTLASQVPGARPVADHHIGWERFSRLGLR